MDTGATPRRTLHRCGGPVPEIYADRCGRAR